MGGGAGALLLYRALHFGLIASLILALGTSFAKDETKELKPSKTLAVSAGLMSALAAGLATYFTSHDFSASLLLSSAAGAVTTGFQYKSNEYSRWIGQKYSWDKTKSGFPSNFVKRSYVGLLVTAGVATVATLPEYGLNEPAPYTWEGFQTVVKSSFIMTVLSTPVNLVLSRLSKNTPDNAGPIRKRIVEIASFLVNGTQSGATAAAITGRPGLSNALHGTLAVVGAAAWQGKWGLPKDCASGLKKITE